MKIVQDKLGKEFFLDLLLTKKECELLKEYMVISQQVKVNGKEVNVGIKISLEEEIKESIW